MIDRFEKATGVNLMKYNIIETLERNECGSARGMHRTIRTGYLRVKS